MLSWLSHFTGKCRHTMRSLSWLLTLTEAKIHLPDRLYWQTYRQQFHHHLNIILSYCDSYYKKGKWPVLTRQHTITHKTHSQIQSVSQRLPRLKSLLPGQGCDPGKQKNRQVNLNGLISSSLLITSILHWTQKPTNQNKKKSSFRWSSTCTHVLNTQLKWDLLWNLNIFYIFICVYILYIILDG